MKTYQVPPVNAKTRKPIEYWTANIVNGLKLNEIDRHESKAILTARNGHAGIIYKAIR